MPESLFVKDFSAGWTPSDDDINGRPNGLLKMDNLELDRNGALTLTGGTVVKQVGYGANAHTAYSRYLNGTRHDYLALADGSIYRDVTSIATGGDATNAAFGTAFNYTLACSGSQKKKDTGAATVNLGVAPPGGTFSLSVNSHNAPIAIIAQTDAGFVAPSGTAVWGGSPASFTITTDATTGIATVQSYAASGAPHNDNLLVGVSATGNATSEDFVIINFGAFPAEGVSFQFDVILSAGNISGDQVPDFYTFRVDDISQLDSFNGLYGSIKIKRSDFARVGNGGQDWSTVYGYRITITATPSFGISVWGSYLGYANFTFQGGTTAQFGTYDYVQMNVNNTGSYIAKSVLGPIIHDITIDGANALITPRNPTLDDAQCNEAWIFRRGGNLDQWYRVLVFTTGGGYATPTYDNLGDQAALILNIRVNLNLISVASIPDKIYDLLGPIQGRWYYFTTNFMYPSDLNDPDLVDPTIAVRTCGSNSELHMWARTISASVVLVGTSHDVYLLTGTFATLPDNSVDIYYQKLGVKFPPITYDAESYGGAVYYLANDGWRSVVATSFGTTYANQNNQLLVSPNTDRLYRGETCYNYSPPNITISPGVARFPIVISRNKLWCFITGTNRIEVYDFLRQYWRPISYGLGDVTAATSTQDGAVLGFYGTDKKTREICVLSSKLIDGATKQTINYLGHVLDNGQPRQRKDTYTFKSRCYTSSSGSLSVTINGTAISGTLASTAAATEQFLDLSQTSAIQLVKTYQIAITGQCNDIIIEDFSIDYDSRPVPVTFLRILPNNYGTAARKRLYTVPFQIDTLSNDVLTTPRIDGTNFSALTVNSSRKKSFEYQFGLLSTELNPVGVDYEWTINGQGKEFEWYGFQELRNIEIFPEQRSSLVIPVTNFGSAVKKRVRGWPFIINTLSNSLTLTPIVDGATLAPTTILTTDKKTIRVFYKTDVFGIDYSGILSGGLFELWDILQPDIVQILPPARQFDQVGPQEFLRFGKILKIELRVLPFGTSIPYNIYFSDSSVKTGSLVVTSGVEDSYFIDMPKGVSGRILRVEIGPTSFDFHRYYMRFLCAPSGGQENTQLQWITIPNTGMEMM